MARLCSRAPVTRTKSGSRALRRTLSRALSPLVERALRGLLLDVRGAEPLRTTGIALAFTRRACARHAGGGRIRGSYVDAVHSRLRLFLRGFRAAMMRWSLASLRCFACACAYGSAIARRVVQSRSWRERPR